MDTNTAPPIQIREVDYTIIKNLEKEYNKIKENLVREIFNDIFNEYKLLKK